jgi:hypothetical protein
MFTALQIFKELNGFVPQALRRLLQTFAEISRQTGLVLWEIEVASVRFSLTGTK